MVSEREVLSRIGRKGGMARVAKMTAKQRKAAASKAAKARWTNRVVWTVTSRSRPIGLGGCPTIIIASGECLGTKGPQIGSQFYITPVK